MTDQSQFVVTITKRDSEPQTFVFPGNATLDTVFEEVTKRDRSKSLSDIAKGDDYRVFRLSVSRDESAGPVAPSIFDTFAQHERPTAS